MTDQRYAYLIIFHLLPFSYQRILDKAAFWLLMPGRCVMMMYVLVTLLAGPGGLIRKC